MLKTIIWTRQKKNPQYKFINFKKLDLMQINIFYRSHSIVFQMLVSKWFSFLSWPRPKKYLMFKTNMDQIGLETTEQWSKVMTELCPSLHQQKCLCLFNILLGFFYLKWQKMQNIIKCIFYVLQYISWIW